MPQALGTFKQGTYGVNDLFTEQRKNDKDKSKFFVWRERGYASMVHVLITALPKVSVSDPEPKHFEDGYRSLAIPLTGQTIVGTAGTAPAVLTITFDTTTVQNFQVNQVWENGSIYMTTNQAVTAVTTSLLRGLDPNSTGDAANTYFRRENMSVLTVNTGSGQVTFRRHIGADTFLGGASNPAVATTMTLYLHSTANTDGSGSPASFSQNPVVVNNFVQIFKEPYEITDVTQKTDIFGENEWQRKARNARRNFARQLERAFLDGIQYKYSDAGEWKWFTGGINEFIPEDSDHRVNFNAVPTVTNLNTKLKPVFDFGSGEKWGFCGYGAITKVGNAMADGLRFNDKLSTSLALEVRDIVQTAGGVIHLVPDYEMSQMNKDTEILIADISYTQYMYLEGEDIKIDKGKNGTGLQLPDQKKTIHQIYGTVGMKRSFADTHYHFYNLL